MANANCILHNALCIGVFFWNMYFAEVLFKIKWFCYKIEPLIFIGSWIVWGWFLDLLDFFQLMHWNDWNVCRYVSPLMWLGLHYFCIVNSKTWIQERKIEPITWWNLKIKWNSHISGQRGPQGSWRSISSNTACATHQRFDIYDCKTSHVVSLRKLASWCSPALWYISKFLMKARPVAVIGYTSESSRIVVQTFWHTE